MLQRFHFSSTLKRMSAVVLVTGADGARTVMAVAKGAPEVRRRRHWPGSGAGARLARDPLTP